MEATQLTFNAEDDRIYMGNDGLHCGDVIEILLPGGWTETSVEKAAGHPDGGWYATAKPSVSLVEVFARKLEDKSF